MSLSYLKCNNEWSVSVMKDGKVTPYTFNEDHPDYHVLLSAMKDNDVDAFLNNINIKTAMTNYVSDEEVDFVVNDDGVFMNGEPVHHSMVDRILENMHAGVPYENMVAFLRNLLENPSFNSREQLYNFLSHEHLPITEDGCFLAYKSVKDNYKDKYSGTFDNSIGAVVEMDRGQVDDNCSHHCSKGFHVGALEYAGPGGWYNDPEDRVIIVKVNPRDAVSVPTDHSFQKLRVCKYEVVGDYKAPMDRPCYKADADELNGYVETQVPQRYVNLDDLKVGDRIVFQYYGEERYGYIEEIYRELVNVWDEKLEEDTLEEQVVELYMKMYGKDEEAGEYLYFDAEEVCDIEFE